MDTADIESWLLLVVSHAMHGSEKDMLLLVVSHGNKKFSAHSVHQGHGNGESPLQEAKMSAMRGHSYQSLGVPGECFEGQG